jgi:hypothetical protein
MAAGDDAGTEDTETEDAAIEAALQELFLVPKAKDKNGAEPQAAVAALRYRLPGLL